MTKIRWQVLTTSVCLITYVHAMALTPYSVMGSTDVWFDPGDTKLNEEAVNRVRTVFAKVESCGPRWQQNTRVQITSGALNPQSSADTAQFSERAKALHGLATAFGFELKQIHTRIDPLAHSVSGEMRRNGAPHEHYVRVFIHCIPHS